jgi:hypothetical protein
LNLKHFMSLNLTGFLSQIRRWHEHDKNMRGKCNKGSI